MCILKVKLDPTLYEVQILSADGVRSKCCKYNFKTLNGKDRWISFRYQSGKKFLNLKQLKLKLYSFRNS